MKNYCFVYHVIYWLKKCTEQYAFIRSVYIWKISVALLARHYFVRYYLCFIKQIGNIITDILQSMFSHIP
jgi:hypothetical protein